MSHSTTVPPSVPTFELQTKLFGFANLGNTCFLNTALQVICRSPPLLSELLRHNPSSHIYRKDSKKTDLVQSLLTLLSDVWKPTHANGQVYLPTQFVRTLATTCKSCDDDWFQPRQQADAAECLQYILNSIHDALFRTVSISVHGQARTSEHISQLKALQSWSTFFQREYSPIVKHFYGQNQIQIQCEGCGNVSERFEPWMMMKLPIPGGDTAESTVPSLHTCLDAYHAPEYIDGYDCEKCKTPQRAKIQTRISKLPNILIIVLKRFTNTGRKIGGTVVWDPDNVDFNAWIAFQRCPFTQLLMKDKNISYETFSIIEHLGSAGSGHYRMYNRIPNSNQWTNLDDDFTGTNGSIRTSKDVVSPNAYILVMMPRASRIEMLESAEKTLQLHQNPDPK